MLDLSGEAADDVFAFGEDELIMHFDGQHWSHEHLGAKVRRPRGASILHASYYAGSKLVAFGPTSLLVRQEDRRWQRPADDDVRKLIDQAESGPPGFSPPARCKLAGWFWLGRDRAMFDCHDGRSFTFDGGRVTPKGVLPGECRRSIDDVTSGQGELFASCGRGRVWKTDTGAWRLYASFPGVKELVSISVTDACVFVASNRAVWRHCDQ